MSNSQMHKSDPRPVIKKVRRITPLLLYCITLLISGIYSEGAKADTIQIRADSWCPYNCEPTDENPGFMIEVAKEVFTKAGHQIDYKTLNWARAIEDTRTGTYTAIAGASKQDAADFIFPEVEQGSSNMCFYTNSSGTWQFTDVGSLKSISFGAIKDYSYSDEIDKFIEENAKNVNLLSGDDALEKGLKMLEAGRIDAFIDDKNVIQNYFKAEGQTNPLREAGCGAQDPVYIAFSPANPKSKEYAELLSKGIQEMRTSGKFAEILKKYGLTDWK